MTARGPVVTVDGARQLRRALAGTATGLDDLKAAHGDAARTVADTAQPATPWRTGRLAGTVRASGTKTAAVVRAGSAAVPYAGPIHYGWPARGIVGRPWISIAADRTSDRWTAVYAAAVDRILASQLAAAGVPA